MALDEAGSGRASSPTCSRTSRAGTATCSPPSRRGPTRWRRPSPGTRRSAQTQRQLVGAYFLNEYSFEASALFNPSIVAHPDQSLAPAGGLRFILSLRAVGEGHVSSLTFRAGTITKDGSVTIDPTARLAATPRVVSCVRSGRATARRSCSFRPAATSASG